MLLALPVSLLGCGKQPTALEIASNVENAYSQVKTYAVEDSVTAATEVVGGNRPGKTETSQNGSGLVDTAGRKMKELTSQNGSLIQGMQSFTEAYLIDDWLYVKTDVLGYEDKDHEIWVKLDLKDEQLNRDDRLWKDKDELGQQIELLRTAREVIMLGSEKIKGIDSYVLEIKPDWQVLTEWLSLQPPWRGPDHLDLRNLSRSLSIRQWIAKDTHLLLRAEIEAVYGMVPFDFSRSTVELKGQVNFYDYNKPVKIELPEDAVKAVHGPIS